MRSCIASRRSCCRSRLSSPSSRLSACWWPTFATPWLTRELPIADPMTTAAVAHPLPEPLPAAPPAPAPVPWLAQVMLDTIGRTGARLGAIWIGIIAFLAVFSPFLASSHPYFLKTDDPLLVRQYGHVSSPLLHHLTGSDVSLLILAVVAVILWFKRTLRTSQKLAILSIFILVV